MDRMDAYILATNRINSPPLSVKNRAVVLTRLADHPKVFVSRLTQGLGNVNPHPDTLNIRDEPAAGRNSLGNIITTPMKKKRRKKNKRGGKKNGYLYNRVRICNEIC